MASIFTGRKLKVCCPKCKSKTLTTYEVFEEIVICEVVDGIFPAEATDHEAGSVIGVSCRCDKCDHKWKPRGARSIEDLFEDEEDS